MFDKMADEIFIKAKVDKVKNDWAYQQCVTILSNQMAVHSALMGLSYKRVKSYNKVKASLLKDLNKLKKAGKLA